MFTQFSTTVVIQFGLEKYSVESGQNRRLLPLMFAYILEW